jgi:uncharacterized membrane protein
MHQIEKTIDVERPLGTVYNQWTQFEDWPEFMDGIKSVRQTDATHVRFHAEVAGRDKEWDAEITEQEPDRRISWKSVSGTPNAGTVRFEADGPNRTRVRLVMAYETDGALESVGDALGVLDARVRSTLEDFKDFIESRGTETGGWRGSVQDSRPNR